MKNIIITTDTEFDKTLYNLPPPSAIRRLSSTKGVVELEIYYLFEFSPNGWREWQRVASIKVQILQQLPNVKFKDMTFTKKENELFKIINVKKLYTINELGSFYPKFIKYPKPLYPSSKEELMRNLTLYTKRLYYEGLLHYEAVVAMALHFNIKCSLDYSNRELFRKVKSICRLERTEWREKLKPNELIEAHSKGAEKTNTKKRELSNQKRDKALMLRADGMSLKDIAIYLKVSLRTVNNWKLPKVKK